MYYLCNTLSVFHNYVLFYINFNWYYIPCTINNLGQRINIKQVIVPADCIFNEFRSKKKVKWFIIASTTFTGTDACADSEFFSRGPKDILVFRGIESKAYFR